MKRILSYVIALALAFAPLTSQALPHNNRSDVKSTVKMFVPYTMFSTISNASLGAGAPVLAQENALGFAGVQMEAVGDDIHTIVPLPDNVCVSCPIKVSVLWSTSASTTSQTATWKVLYNATALGEAFAAAGTALDTAIAADAVDDTAFGMSETPQGVISSGTLSRNDVLHILAELDAVSGLNPAASATFFHGLYIEYTRNQL